MTNISILSDQLRQRFARVEESTESAMATVEATSAKTALARQQFLDNTVTLRQRQAEVLDQTEETLVKIEQASRFPEGVRRLLGLFDSDFNLDVQHGRLQRSQLQMNRIGLEQEKLAQAHEFTLEAAQQERADALARLQFDAEGFARIGSMITSNIQVAQEERTAIIDAITGMSDDQISGMASGRVKIPPQFRGKEGLFQLENMRRAAAKANLRATNLSNELQQRAADRDAFLSQFAGSAELRAFLDDPQVAERLPANVGRREIVNEFFRQLSLENDFIAAEAAAASGNQKRVEETRQLLLDQFSVQDLRGLEDYMKRVGVGRARVGWQQDRVTVLPPAAREGFLFGRGEIQQKLAEKLKDNKEIAANNATIAIANDQSEAEVAAIARDVETLALVAGAETLEELPGDVQSAVDRIAIINKNLGEIAKEDMEIAVTMRDMLKAERETLSKQIEETVKNNYVKEAQPAVREYATKQRIDSLGNAAAYMVLEGGSDVEFHDNPVLATPFRMFSSTLAREMQNAKFGEDASGAIQINFGDNKDLTPSFVVGKAVKDSNFLNLFSSQAMQALLTQAARQLGQPELEGITDPEKVQLLGKVFTEFVNPYTGLLSSRFYDTHDDGTSTFNHKTFLVEVERRSRELQTQGILDANESLTMLWLDQAQANIRNGMVRQMFGNTPTGLALMKLTTNNRPEQFVSPKILAMKEQITKAREILDETDPEVRRQKLIEMERLRQRTFPGLDQGRIPRDPAEVVSRAAPKTKSTPPSTLQFPPSQKLGPMRSAPSVTGRKPSSIVPGPTPVPLDTRRTPSVTVPIPRLPPSQTPGASGRSPLTFPLNEELHLPLRPSRIEE